MDPIPPVELGLENESASEVNFETLTAALEAYDRSKLEDSASIGFNVSTKKKHLKFYTIGYMYINSLLLTNFH